MLFGVFKQFLGLLKKYMKSTLLDETIKHKGSDRKS